MELYKSLFFQALSYVALWHLQMYGYLELLQKAFALESFGCCKCLPLGDLNHPQFKQMWQGPLTSGQQSYDDKHTHIFRYCNFNHSDSKLTVTGSGISKSTSLVTHAEVKVSQTFLFPFPFKPTNNTDTMSRNTEDILCVGRGQVDCSPSKP